MKAGLRHKNHVSRKFAILVSMKRLVVDMQNNSEMDLLIRLAEKLQLNFEVIDDENDLSLSLLHLAESSFGKEWNSNEDARWDEILKNDADAS